MKCHQGASVCPVYRNRAEIFLTEWACRETGTHVMLYHLPGFSGQRVPWYWVWFVDCERGDRETEISRFESNNFELNYLSDAKKIPGVSQMEVRTLAAHHRIATLLPLAAVPWQNLSLGNLISLDIPSAPLDRLLDGVHISWQGDGLDYLGYSIGRKSGSISLV